MRLFTTSIRSASIGLKMDIRYYRMWLRMIIPEFGRAYMILCLSCIGSWEVLSMHIWDATFSYMGWKWTYIFISMFWMTNPHSNCVFIHQVHNNDHQYSIILPSYDSNSSSWEGFQLWKPLTKERRLALDAVILSNIGTFNYKFLCKPTYFPPLLSLLFSYIIDMKNHETFISTC